LAFLDAEKDESATARRVSILWRVFAWSLRMALRGQLELLIQRMRRAVGHPTDASLLERFVASRDEAAFELLLWRHGPMVLSVCRRMLRCDHDAEDAFQAAFLLLARKAGAIRRREAVAGWLYQTAYRIALRARETARKRPVAVPPGAEPTAPDSEADSIWHDLRPVLDEEVGRLPEKYRLPIILEGQLLARVDDRLARLDLEVQESKLKAVETGVGQDLRSPIYTKTVLRQAQVAVKEAQITLEMYEIRSSVRGVVKAILKSRGEAVKSLETVVQIQEMRKE
jgi:RNA polymerase sigma factor (sigma-70 family)